MANGGWSDGGLCLFVVYWVEVWKAWSVTADLQFLWYEVWFSSRCEGWKLYLYPATWYQPTLSFFIPYDMRGLILVCRLSKCCSYVHFSFFGSSLSAPLLYLFCVADLSAHSTRSQPSTISRLPGILQNKATRFWRQVSLSLKSVRFIWNKLNC